MTPGLEPASGGPRKGDSAREFVDEVARRMQEEFLLLFPASVLRAADPDNYQTCVGALAITTSIPGATRPYVTVSSMSFNLDGWRYKCPTPPALADRIARYNDGEPIKSWSPVTIRPESVRKSDVTPGARPRGRGGPSRQPRESARRRWRGT